MTSIPSLIEGHDVISDAKEKANLLNEYFAGQSTVDDSSVALPDDANFYQTAEILSHITTSEREIRDLFLTLDVGKACGPDGIGNRIIKMSTDGFVRAFSLFSNLSLQRGVFPAQWKAANIIPLFKKDDRQCKSNYRPVSLLNSLSKVLEKVVFIRLYNFLLGIGFVNPVQSGFRPGDSTVNQLLYLVHKTYEALEHGNEVRMIYLDISKAFDRVWHDGLLFKLKSIGIRDPLLAWLKSYLSDRKQRVIIDGQSSEWTSVKAGVHQGSVLGPLLFLIYINDITQNIKSECLLYADDTSLFHVVEDPALSFY